MKNVKVAKPKPPLMSERLRALQREYRNDLLDRVRLVACPTCGVGPEQFCRSDWAKKDAAGWCHGARHREAKLAGHVKGSTMIPPLPPNYQHQAYCVATLDISVDPPQIAHVSIYSSEAANLSVVSRQYCNVDVTSAYGGSYQEAHDALLKQLATYPMFQWASRWIAEKRSHR